MFDGSAARAAFQRDGIVRLPHALSPATMAKVTSAFDWSRANPGPGAANLPAKGDGTFYQDLANPAALTRYVPLVREPEIAALATGLLGQSPVWFMYEQVFLKADGETRRTPWHQDTPYLPVDGPDLLVLWITLEPVAAANALEFVRGSHRGPLYDGSRFDPADDTLPLYGTGDLPVLPDIEADRGAWDIVSWDVNPGDVLAFHPSMLHGGAPTHAGLRRRTVSLRFFGADARVAQRPGMVVVENDPGLPEEGLHPLTAMRRRRPGTPFRHPAFPEVAVNA
jgi:ectoine hydroxylase-related dioxygenase (phytanoyl-CoA dioxygenase family)